METLCHYVRETSSRKTLEDSVFTIITVDKYTHINTHVHKRDTPYHGKHRLLLLVKYTHTQTHTHTNTHTGIHNYYC